MQQQDERPITQLGDVEPAAAGRDEPMLPGPVDQDVRRVERWLSHRRLLGGSGVAGAGPLERGHGLLGRA